MIDADAYATLIADWCLEVLPGQQILIETTTLAEDAALALHGAILERDAWPLLRLHPRELESSYFRHARDRHLDAFPPIALAEAQAIDSSLVIVAPLDPAALTDVDPALPTRRAKAIQSVREARMSHRWALSIWPTEGLARQAGMPFADYARFVERALFLERPDPLAAWRELSAVQQRIVERLTPARQVRIQSQGTDLTLEVTGRSWRNSDGRRNMPSGEVFTSPHEHSANGTVRFDVPSLRQGAEVADVELRFRDGEVVAAHARHGDAQLQAALATDAGARMLGELGIGTNGGIDRATGSTLLDEKIAGTVHLALGRSYPEAGGRNQSALHWDLICDLRRGGSLSVDGEILIRDGVLDL